MSAQADVLTLRDTSSLTDELDDATARILALREQLRLQGEQDGQIAELGVGTTAYPLRADPPIIETNLQPVGAGALDQGLPGYLWARGVAGFSHSTQGAGSFIGLESFTLLHEGFAASETGKNYYGARDATSREIERIAQGGVGNAEMVKFGKFVFAESDNYQNLQNQMGTAFDYLDRTPARQMLGDAVHFGGEQLPGIVLGVGATKAFRAFSTIDEIASDAVLGKPQGIILQAEFKEGMDPIEFQRKLNRLQNAIDRGEVNSNIPHDISDAERRAMTRQYRNDVADRIESFYTNNPTARDNALTRLRSSDIDHILDLQLGGANARGNLKSLESFVNQDLGRQFSLQLPRDASRPVVGIEVKGYRWPR